MVGVIDTCRPEWLRQARTAGGGGRGRAAGVSFISRRGLIITHSPVGLSIASTAQECRVAGPLGLRIWMEAVRARRHCCIAVGRGVLLAQPAAVESPGAWRREGACGER